MEIERQLKCITEDGRIRKNWKNHFRKISKRFKKEACEICGSKDNLSIHHKIPLRENIIITEDNCVTLCEKCHDKVDYKAKHTKPFVFKRTRSLLRNKAFKEFQRGIFEKRGIVIEHDSNEERFFITCFNMGFDIAMKKAFDKTDARYKEVLDQLRNQDRDGK